MSVLQALRQEIEETRQAYHQLLDSIPDEAFALPSRNPAWTNGEVLYHMSIAPRMLGRDVKAIVGQSWLYRLIPLVVSKTLFDRLNKVLTRYGARNMSRMSLAEAYDRAHESALRALDGVSEEDMRKRLTYPDWDPTLSGEVTLERLFRYVRVHFRTHAAQIVLEEAKT